MQSTIKINRETYIIVDTKEIGPLLKGLGWNDAILVKKPAGKIHWYANRAADGQIGPLVRLG
jgi:hypothetical protein